MRFVFFLGIFDLKNLEGLFRINCVFFICVREKVRFYSFFIFLSLLMRNCKNKNIK